MYLLNIFFLLTSAHFTLNCFFKQQYQNFLFNVSYCIFYNYGKLEILLKQNYKMILSNSYVENFLDKIEDAFKSFKTYDTEIILGNEIVARSMHNSIIYQIGYEKLQQVDFMIYNQDIKHKKTNKVIFYDVSDITLLLDKIENCDYHFLSLNIKITSPEMKNKHYDIDFLNNKETLYVVNNRINVFIISYLLKVQHNLITDPYLLSYEITVIDQNASFFTLTEKDELILFKNHYERVLFNVNKMKERKHQNVQNVLSTLDKIKNYDLGPKINIDTQKIYHYCDAIYSSHIMNNLILQESTSECECGSGSEWGSGSGSEGEGIRKIQEDYDSDNSYEKLE